MTHPNASKTSLPDGGCLQVAFQTQFLRPSKFFVSFDDMKVLNKAYIGVTQGGKFLDERQISWIGIFIRSRTNIKGRGVCLAECLRTE
jgi:hypothetical protein